MDFDLRLAAGMAAARTARPLDPPSQLRPLVEAILAACDSVADIAPPATPPVVPLPVGSPRPDCLPTDPARVVAGDMVWDPHDRVFDMAVVDAYERDDQYIIPFHGGGEARYEQDTTVDVAVSTASAIAYNRSRSAETVSDLDADLQRWERGAA